MSKAERLVQRLLSLPNDFTWEEFIKLLRSFGFIELPKGKTGGSRRKFMGGKHNVINLHTPHPGNVVKRYQLRQIIDRLSELGYIKNE
jgi:hypothetical protein